MRGYLIVNKKVDSESTKWRTGRLRRDGQLLSSRIKMLKHDKVSNKVAIKMLT